MPCSSTQHGLTGVGLEPPTSGSGDRGINNQANALPSPGSDQLEICMTLYMYIFIDLYALYFASRTTSFFHATMEYLYLMFLNYYFSDSFRPLRHSFSPGLERKSIKCNTCSIFAVVLSVCVCGGGGGVTVRLGIPF